MSATEVLESSLAVDLEYGRAGSPTAGAGDTARRSRSGEVVPQTPLTNRGSVTPAEGLRFHLDYLSLTVFPSGVLSATTIVEKSIENVLALKDIPADVLALGPKGKFWSEVCQYTAAQVEVRQPVEGEFLCICISGQGCDILGDGGIAELIEQLKGFGGRWHSTRVDITWDGCGFRPADLFDAAKAGCVKSRVSSAKCVEWKQNDEGRTASLGDRKAPFYLRCYDRRGFTRTEAELKGDWAKSFGAEVLAQLPADQWAEQAVKYLLRGVDLVDVTAASRIERCPRLPWWSEFVGAAEKLKRLALSKREKDADTRPFAPAYDRLIRVRKSVAALVEAFGWDWVVQQVNAVRDDLSVQAIADTLRPVAGIAAMQLKPFGATLESELQSQACPI